MESIMSLQEAGILRKFYYDELNPPVYVPLPRYKFDQPIDLTMIITPFVFVSAMLLLSLLTFTIEYCIGPRHQVKVKLLKNLSLLTVNHFRIRGQLSNRHGLLPPTTKSKFYSQLPKFILRGRA